MLRPPNHRYEANVPMNIISHDVVMAAIEDGFKRGTDKSMEVKAMNGY